MPRLPPPHAPRRRGHGTMFLLLALLALEQRPGEGAGSVNSLSYAQARAWLTADRRKSGHYVSPIRWTPGLDLLKANIRESKQYPELRHGLIRWLQLFAWALRNPDYRKWRAP